MDDIDEVDARAAGSAGSPFSSTGLGGARSGFWTDSGNGVIPLSTRYKQWYLGLPCRMLHLFVLVVTIVLLVATFLRAQPWWYHTLEWLIMILFVGEVGTSLFFLRRRYFDEWVNIAEFIICVICTGSYLVVLGHTVVNREEHEAILILRYVGQLLRLTMFCRLAVESKRGRPMVEIRPQIISKGDSDDDVEEYEVSRRPPAGVLSPAPTASSAIPPFPNNSDVSVAAGAVVSGGTRTTLMSAVQPTRTSMMSREGSQTVIGTGTLSPNPATPTTARTASF